MPIRPIFVGGCERSGTTFLGALLGAAPGAVTVPESSFRYAGLRAADAGAAAPEALARMLGHAKYRNWRVAGEADPVAPTTASHRDLVETLVRRYARSREEPDPAVWVDHTPRNTRYALRIAGDFPDARFLHIVRDGRGVAASVMPLVWGPNTIRGAAEYWTARLAYGLALEGSALAARTMRVRYEDLLAAPEPTLRRLCEFCELEFRPEMLAGGRFDLPASTQRQHRLVGQPPLPSRATAWEGDLSDREVEIFEAHAGEMLAMMGYDLRYGVLARRERRAERFRMRAAEAWRGRVVNRLRKRASAPGRSSPHA